VPLLLNEGSFSKASAPPPFLEDENIFKKSASMVALLLQFLVQPWWPIFGKSSHLREKGGVLMLLKTTHHLFAKAQYMYMIHDTGEVRQKGGIK
jgi:hypothetical protein